MLRDGDRLLFQGDSITDAARNRSGENAVEGRDLGRGYAMQVAAHLACDRPGSGVDVRNLGISGNRIVDLHARIKEHCWNLIPDVLSILIGINDTWHERNRRAGVEVERYAEVYRLLLEETRARLPDLRLVLCEPFVLDCGVVESDWREEVDRRRAVVAQLAEAFDARLVGFQDAFDRACDDAPPEHWAEDGVHPTPAGHLLMARTWLAAVE